MLARLEPMALPIEMPGLPWKAAITDTTSSGAEVPKPTITMPTISGEMPMVRASPALP